MTDPEFTSRDGKFYFDGEWPEVWFIERRLLREADPQFLRVDGDRLYVNAENGNATYLIGELDPNPLRDGWALTRLYARRTP